MERTLDSTQTAEFFAAYIDIGLLLAETDLK
jgi:hypothetical protein